MADFVWNRVNRELERRREKGQLPNSWASLGRKIGASAQVLTNWKSRGVPPKAHYDIAKALQWSVDELLTVEEPRPVEAIPTDAPPFDPDTMDFAAKYQALAPDARSKLRVLFYVAMDGKQPPETWRAPGAGADAQKSGSAAFDSGLGDLDAPTKPQRKNSRK